VAERVLAERIAIRETEIAKSADDKDHSSQELARVEQEVAVLQRTLEQTRGFRETLAMDEAPLDPEDPDDQAYLQWIDENPEAVDEDRVVKIEVEHLGKVGVDSGQLLITDPCYIDGEWQDQPYRDDRVYKDVQTGQP
jgi:hypothetical protein